MVLFFPFNDCFCCCCSRFFIYLFYYSIDNCLKSLPYKIVLSPYYQILCLLHFFHFILFYFYCYYKRLQLLLSRFRNIKMSSPYLNNMIIIGCILTYTSVILLGLNSGLTSENNFPYICAVSIDFVLTTFTFIHSLIHSILFISIFIISWFSMYASN